MKWRHKANCRGTYHPDAFAQGEKSAIIRKAWADKWCPTCPVRTQCLNYAYQANRIIPGALARNPIQWGIWGGRDFTRASGGSGQESVTAWRERIGQNEWDRRHSEHL